jgi:uncharacterized protein (TIGR03083 family)
MTVDRRLAAFLIATESLLDLLERPAVRDKWTAPSALDEMSVGDLAAHVVSNASIVARAAAAVPPDEEPVALLEHYARSTWVGAPLDNDANAGIRASARQTADAGLDRLLADAQTAVAQLRTVQEGSLPPTARLPWWQWSLSFEDFLVVRTMETVVHTDDLAVSIGVEPPVLAEAVLEPVLSLLVMLSARRHGQAAVLRALARRERAGQPINAL